MQLADAFPGQNTQKALYSTGRLKQFEHLMPFCGNMPSHALCHIQHSSTNHFLPCALQGSSAASKRTVKGNLTSDACM